MIERIEAGAELITIETIVKRRPRVLNYKDILAAIKVECDDDYYDAPWDSCDGFEHTFTPGRKIEHEGARGAVGWTWNAGERDYGLITIDDEIIRNQWGFDSKHFPGMSKQPLAELVAEQKRQAIEQIAQWYSRGWEWWNTSCNVRITADGVEECNWRQADYRESVGGIDDINYASGEIAQDVAGMIASALEKDGFEVINKPAPYDAKAAKLENLKLKLQSNLV